MDARGTHILVDLYGVRDPGDACVGILLEVARIAECRVVWKKTHTFKGGGGRTAMVMLSTSHASIHTWPEHRYASFDLYSCRELSADVVRKVIDYVRNMTFAERHRTQVVPRGHVVPDAHLV